VDRMDKRSRALRVAGGLAFVLATLQYGIAQLIAASAWNPPYSWRNNFISDLGNTACGPFAVPHGRPTYVCSPDHALMNASFALTGLLTIAGTLLLWRLLAPRKITTVALRLMLVAGALKIVVGLAPENTNVPLHLLGAFNLPLQSVAILMVSITLAARHRSLKVFGLVTAVTGIAGAGLSTAARHAGTALYLGLGSGGMERVAGYPGNLWMLVAGILVIATTQQSRGWPNVAVVGHGNCSHIPLSAGSSRSSS